MVLRFSVSLRVSPKNSPQKGTGSPKKDRPPPPVPRRLGAVACFLPQRQKRRYLPLGSMFGNDLKLPKQKNTRGTAFRTAGVLENQRDLGGGGGGAAEMFFRGHIAIHKLEMRIICLNIPRWVLLGIPAKVM